RPPCRPPYPHIFSLPQPRPMPMHRQRLPLALFLLFFATLAAAFPPLERIMDDPDWIGPPVEAAWPSLDGRQVYYFVKRAGSPVRDLHRIDLATGEDRSEERRVGKEGRRREWREQDDQSARTA